MTLTGRPYETEELLELRELQGRQLDAAPQVTESIAIPVELTGVPARAAELALRRAAARLMAEDEYLRSYLDRCVNGRGPQVALELVRSSEVAPSLATALRAQLDRPQNGQLRSSEVPLTVREPLLAWVLAVRSAADLAQR